MRVRVTAPATVANLGPGFDCMGLAVSLSNVFEIEQAPDHELVIEAEGPFSRGLRIGAGSGLVRGARSLLGPEAGIRVRAVINLPFARGYGSSAAAIVAGLLAAEKLSGGPSPRPLVDIATEVEGHPDNVAPCLLGGIVVATGGRIVRIPPPRDLRVVACFAPSPFATKKARGALPETLPFATAVAGAGRAALLAAALATGDAASLLEATDDVLHQPARLPLMPETQSLVAGLRARGFAAFLSGAGPSVSALVPAAEAGEASALAREVAAPGWDVRVLDIAATGAVAEVVA